jgi:hypothetical protein
VHQTGSKHTFSGHGHISNRSTIQKSFLGKNRASSGVTEQGEADKKQKGSISHGMQKWRTSNCKHVMITTTL